MSENTKSGNYIVQAWLVISLAILYGVGLAGMQINLADKIAENKRNETYNVIPDLVSGAVKENTVEIMVKAKDGKESKVYKAVDVGGNTVGWVLPAEGLGFADRIELLIGLDASLDKITGMYVIDQKETPGLGDYITRGDFRKRFVGKPAATPIAVVKKDPTAKNEIKALTGATISSESVSGIINKAIGNLREPILSSN
jgi:H+/Na+-translocating ferredoxin:NAD+ oxidoreductase subunit G